jgi:hypothetical protein
MRTLEINKQTIFYALYLGKVPVLDSDGYETGDFKNGYANPVSIKIRVSPNKGESNSQAFGLSLDYDRTMTTTDKLPITEFSIIWIDSSPLLEADGSLSLNELDEPITPHEYTVVRVAKDLNVAQYAIKKVS